MDEIIVPTGSVLIFNGFSRDAGAERCPKYCLQYHMYWILEDVQHNNAITFSYNSYLSKSVKGKEDKAECDSSVIVPVTKDDTGQDHHQMHANTIPDDYQKNFYLFIPFKFFRVYIYSYRHHFSLRIS